MSAKKGFTIIELLVVMGVIAVLIGMSVFGINALLESQRNTERRNAGSNLRAGIQSYQSNSLDRGLLPVALAKNAGDTAIELRDGTGTVLETIPLEGAAQSTEFCYQLETDGYRLAVQLENDSWEQYGTATDSAGIQLPCETANV